MIQKYGGAVLLELEILRAGIESHEAVDAAMSRLQENEFQMKYQIP